MFPRPLPLRRVSWAESPVLLTWLDVAFPFRLLLDWWPPVCSLPSALALVFLLPVETMTTSVHVCDQAAGDDELGTHHRSLLSLCNMLARSQKDDRTKWSDTYEVLSCVVTATTSTVLLCPGHPRWDFWAKWTNFHNLLKGFEAFNSILFIKHHKQ